MKLSSRLLSCAGLVQRGSVAADVGTDHGYLAVYLLKEGICPHVYAADLREQPLAAARRSAARAGVADRMTFCRCDGLEGLPVERLGTVVCAGMGGDTILGILERARENWRPSLQLVLQPQSAVNVLRRWLGEQGFSVLREVLSRDGRFIYTAMEVSWGGGVPLSPGQQFMPRSLMERGGELLRPYFYLVKDSVSRSVQGLRQARTPQPESLAYYESALRELEEMEEQYGLRQ